MAETTDPEAPHGRDSEGVPLAPYGHRADGRPKLSNRGRTAKAPPKKGTTNTRSGARKRTKDETKEQLVELAGMVTSGMSALSSAPPVRKRIGDRHSDALAGDAVILDAFVPHFADVTLMFAQTRPGLLAWMDQVEEKAPILALVKVGGMCAKAIIGNHLAPDPELAVVEIGRAHV